MSSSRRVMGTCSGILVIAVGILCTVSAGWSQDLKQAKSKSTAKPDAKKARTAVLGKAGAGGDKGGEAKSSTKKSSTKASSETEMKKARSAVLGKPGTAGKQSSAKSESPLGRLIKNIFGNRTSRPGTTLLPKPHGETEKDLDPSSSRGDPTARDAVDALAPYNPDQGRLLRRATNFIEEKDWEQALPLLRYLVDPRDPRGLKRPLSDSLIRTDDDKWVSVVSKANGLLGTFPAEYLDRMRLQFGVEAKQELLEAERKRDMSAVAEITTRYYHTQAGQQAANRLGSFHFDRGEFGMASRWFKQLIEMEAPVAKDPQWQMKAAFAFRRAGDEEISNRVLSEVASASRTIDLGGGRFDPKSWLEKEPALASLSRPMLEDWPMFMGTPGHTGTAVGGEPLLLPRWTYPTTHRRPIQERISVLMDDLADENRATIPASFPLMIDGKVIFRTLRGVQVVDGATGKSLWETREGVSPEMMLSGEKPQQTQYAQDEVVFVQQVGGFASSGMYSSSGSNVDQQPLTSLLYRDGLNGIISSDGDRLFAVEKHALLPTPMNQHYSPFGGNSSRNDPYRRDWASNKISSYELGSGRVLWDVGGKKMNETFDPPLAGTYFFGAPVPDGEELLVVGEKDGEIHLYALDAATGMMQWSQLIAYSDTRIEKEYGRRLWTAQPGVGNGVIVCPTTVGWLVGVDRLSHSVLWAYRYTRPNPGADRDNRRRGMAFGSSQTQEQLQPGTLNSRWAPSAPVIVGSHVVYAPSEDPNLFCLNLFDGHLIWKKSKSSFLYPAGVFGESIVLVGKDSLSAYALKDGKNLWSLKISSEDGPPSGVGVTADGNYLLPLQSGQLWTINLAKGEILSRSFLPDGRRPLGNLAMYRGTLLALNPLGMTSFEQRDTVRAEIERRKQANPFDVWALLRESDIHALHREYPQALALLRKIRPEDVTREFQQRYRKSMIDTLASIVRTDYAAHDGELAELAQFVRSDDEKMLLSRLMAERFTALEKYQQAFDVYWKMYRENDQPGDERIAREDAPQITLRFSAWIAGKLSDLWSQMSPESRNQLDLNINEAAQAALKADPAARKRFAALFAFHPSALPVQRRLVEDYASTGNVARAEMLLLKLSRHPDAAQRAASIERAARLMTDAELHEDAGHYYELLENDYAAVKLPDGRNVEDLMRAQRETEKQNSSRQPQSSRWGKFDLKVTRSGVVSYGSSRIDREVVGIPARLPFYQDHRLTINNQRLAVTRTSDASLHWLTPLRSATGGSQSNYYASLPLGHQLFLVNRDVLHCLSPVDRRVLWTRPLETRNRAGSYYRQASRLTPQPMQNGVAIASNSSLERQASTYGMLAAVAGDYVCVYGRRRITVLDAASGDVRWELDRLQRGTNVFGSDEVIYVVPPNQTETIALRSLDGKKLDLPKAVSLFNQAIRISGNDLILVESSSSSILGFSRRNAIVRCYNPLTKKEDWKIEYPNGTYLSLLDDGALVALTPSHQLKLIDLDSGKERDIGEPISQSDLKSRNQLYVVGDRQNVYLAVNRQRSRTTYWGGSEIPSLYLNGLIVAFDRKSGKLLWKQDVSNQQLVFQQLGISPILLFSMRDYERSGNLNYWKTTLLAIDKTTGRRLLDSSMPMNYGGFQSMEVNLPDRYIELRSYNEMVRLEAVDRDTASSK